MLINARDIAKSVIAEMEGKHPIPNPAVAKVYKRLAIIDYASALKNSPLRTPEHNERAMSDVYVLAEKAIALGVPRESMDQSLRVIRNYWIPKLAMQ